MAGPDRINRGICRNRPGQGRTKVTRVVVADIPENAGRDLSVEQSIPQNIGEQHSNFSGRQT